MFWHNAIWFCSVTDGDEFPIFMAGFSPKFYEIMDDEDIANSKKLKKRKPDTYTGTHELNCVRTEKTKDN